MIEVDNSQSDLFQLSNEMEFGDIHFKHDSETGLNAIIAIHNTNLGPALGGCRFVPYHSTQAAMYDAMRLAQGMSYKAAIAGLELGGGKSVIIKPPKIKDRQKLFAAFGCFIEELNGRYITAIDSGTTVDDMDAIATTTSYVASTSQQAIATGDPSPYTALGVRRAIEAAVKIKFNKDSLDGIHVAIQGMGHVGYYLAKELHELGANLSFCDINPENTEKAKKAFAGVEYSADEIFDVECDVFAPCALGDAINKKTVGQLNTGIIVGAANNQLASPEIGKDLQERDILYVPNYVANAGGLIQIAMDNEEKALTKVNNIYETVLNIFQASKRNNQTPEETANFLAKQIIVKAGTKNAA